MKVLVEVSARHVHLSQEAVDVLFGENHTLTHKRELSQPGQFACEERVNIIGPKSSIGNVIVLGPVRPRTQVEISVTDARRIGLSPVIRESGDLEGTPGCVIAGPKGEYELKEGVIVAKRHVHMTPKDAEKLAVQDGQICKVKVKCDDRSLTFDDVVVRVNSEFALAMHIDTDEGNAMNHQPSAYGEIIL